MCLRVCDILINLYLTLNAGNQVIIARVLFCSVIFGNTVEQWFKICSRQGYFELMSVDRSDRLRGIIGISFQYSLT